MWAKSTCTNIIRHTEILISQKTAKTELDSCIHSFIHIEHLYGTSSRREQLHFFTTKNVRICLVEVREKGQEDSVGMSRAIASS